MRRPRPRAAVVRPRGDLPAHGLARVHDRLGARDDRRVLVDARSARIRVVEVEADGLIRVASLLVHGGQVREGRGLPRLRRAPVEDDGGGRVQHPLLVVALLGRR